jgi:hypothetical protein
MASFWDGLFNPSKNTERAYSQATAERNRVNAQTNPYYEGLTSSGTAATSRLGDLLGLNGRGAQQAGYDSYMNSPGFDANFEVGQRAIRQNQAATGNLQSGAAGKALQGFGQNLYAQDFNTYLGQLAGQQNVGMGGAQGLQGNSSALQQLILGSGQAQDAGNRGFAGNVLGIGGTLAGLAFGAPTGGRLFGGNSLGQANSAFAQFADPWSGMRG